MDRKPTLLGRMERVERELAREKESINGQGTPSHAKEHAPGKNESCVLTNGSPECFVPFRGGRLLNERQGIGPAVPARTSFEIRVAPWTLLCMYAPRTSYRRVCKGEMTQVPIDLYIAKGVLPRGAITRLRLQLEAREQRGESQQDGRKCRERERESEWQRTLHRKLSG